MERITLVLDRKEVHFRAIAPDCFVTDALQQMRSENLDYLVVMNDEGKFLGILTDHDIATNAIFGRKPLKKALVLDIMNTRFPVVTVEDTVEKCMRTMRQHNVRYLPVFDGFDFRGVISSDDLINEVVANRMNIFDPEEEHTYHFA